MTITSYPNGRHRARVRLKGKYYSDTFDTLEEAQNFEVRKRSEILQLASKAEFDGIKDLTFETAFKAYFNSDVFKAKAPNTQKTERVKAKSLLKYFATLYPSKTNHNDIKDWITHRQSQPTYFNDNKTIRNKEVTGDTIRLEKVTLSNLYKYLNDNGDVSINPFVGYKYICRKPNKSTNVIDTDTLNAIQGSDAFVFSDNEIFRNWYFFIQSTGMRPGEAAKLLIEYYDKRVHGFNIPPDDVKNRTSHFVSIPKDMREQMRALIDSSKSVGSPYVFYSISKSKQFIPFNYDYCWKKIRNEIKATGVVKFNRLKPHQMRHTFITDIVKYGDFSSFEVMSITGHKTHASIGRYIHLASHRYSDRISAVMERTETELLEDFEEIAIRKMKAEQNKT